jgi:hypothetical protein
VDNAGGKLSDEVERHPEFHIGVHWMCIRTRHVHIEHCSKRGREPATPAARRHAPAAAFATSSTVCLLLLTLSFNDRMLFVPRPWSHRVVSNDGAVTNVSTSV